MGGDTMHDRPTRQPGSQGWAQQASKRASISCVCVLVSSTPQQLPVTQRQIVGVKRTPVRSGRRNLLRHWSGTGPARTASTPRHCSPSWRRKFPAGMPRMKLPSTGWNGGHGRTDGSQSPRPLRCCTVQVRTKCTDFARWCFDTYAHIISNDDDAHNKDVGCLLAVR